MTIDQLAARRFDRADYPEQMQPLDALHAALRDIEPGEARHIIVCMAKRMDDGGSESRYFQGGDYDAAGQVGLLRLIQDRILGL